MKKKELLNKIEELEYEIDLLKERVELLEKRPPAVTYPNTSRATKTSDKSVGHMEKRANVLAIYSLLLSRHSAP